jgi:hypothetical protein
MFNLGIKYQLSIFRRKDENFVSNLSPKARRLVIRIPQTGLNKGNVQYAKMLVLTGVSPTGIDHPNSRDFHSKRLSSFLVHQSRKRQMSALTCRR